MIGQVQSVLARIWTIEARFGGSLVQPAAEEPPAHRAAGAGENAGGDRQSFEAIAEQAAHRHGLDPALVKAVIWAESGFNPRATSPAGAMGLMQLMPGTARGLGVTDPYDPGQNIDGGSRYLAGLLRRYGDVALSLAGYNAGPNAVARHGGIPPYRETQQYVERVLAMWNRLRSATPFSQKGGNM